MSNQSSIYQYLERSREDEELEAARFDRFLAIVSAEAKSEMTRFVGIIEKSCKGIGNVGAKFLAMRVYDHLNKSDLERKQAAALGKMLQDLQRK